eukprot:1152525-Pelagomonas_calceolata.AAC.5
MNGTTHNGWHQMHTYDMMLAMDGSRCGNVDFDSKIHVGSYFVWNGGSSHFQGWMGAMLAHFNKLYRAIGLATHIHTHTPEVQ